MSIASEFQDTLAIILGGGQGSRLQPLTRRRAKPAVPLGGLYRLIDVPISNCLNSGIDRIFVLTQFNSASLNRHVNNTYKLDIFSRGFVEILAAQQTMESDAWFQGTADAVRQNLPRFRSRTVDRYLILAGDHLYRMDYRRLLAYHQRKKADITVSVLPVFRDSTSQFGILQTDSDGQVVRFVEKPSEKQLKPLVWKSAKTPEKERFIASMGIYVFQAGVMEELLKNRQHVDFGKDVFPSSISKYRVCAYPFWGYWEDIGTIRTFYEANIALTRPDPPFNFHTTDCPIYTRPRFLPPVKVLESRINNSILSAGARIEGASVEESVVGLRSIIRPGTLIRRSILMGADYYQSDSDFEQDTVAGRPVVGIGRDVVIENAIIDKNARVGDRVQILDKTGVGDFVGDGYCVRDGLVIVEKDAIIPSGTVI